MSEHTKVVSEIGSRGETSDGDLAAWLLAVSQQRRTCSEKPDGGGEKLHAGDTFFALFPEPVRAELKDKLERSLHSLPPRVAPLLLYHAGPFGCLFSYRAKRSCKAGVLVQVRPISTAADDACGSGCEKISALPDFYQLAVDELKECVDEFLAPVANYQRLCLTSEKSDPYVSIRSHRLVSLASEKLTQLHRLITQTHSPVTFQQYVDLCRINSKIDVAVSIKVGEVSRATTSVLYGVVLQRAVRFVSQYGIADRMQVTLENNTLNIACNCVAMAAEDVFLGECGSLFLLARQHGYCLEVLFTTGVGCRWTLQPAMHDHRKNYT